MSFRVDYSNPIRGLVCPVCAADVVERVEKFDSFERRGIVRGRRYVCAVDEGHGLEGMTVPRG